MQKSIIRYDIQALRALAVITVILYHFEVNFTKGGYIGVDIFFVISGYLISKSIIKKLDDNNFDFINFYFDRMKRLYPALLVTIACTYLISFFVFSPADFKELSASSIFASVGVSNIYFWLTSGYFDNFTSLKPLLHTWSLGVEFQFYFFWPLFLFLLHRLKKIQIFIILLIITIVSGIIAYKYLKYDATGAFFLMPFRIHEFSLGSLVYIIYKKNNGYKILNNFLYVLGVILIFFAIYNFNINTTSFPGKAVWIPLVGSALMIYSGSNLYYDKFIKNKFVLYIGEISYSLYLTHWPIFVFYRYFFPENYSSIKNISILIILTFIASAFLYKFVEKPCRQNIFQYSKSLYTIICQSLLISLIMISICSFIGNGWIWRFPKNLRIANNINIEDMHKYTWAKQIPYSQKKNFSNNGKEKILIIGDSQSADLINLLTENGLDKNFDIVAKTIFTECSLPYIEEKERKFFFSKIDEMTIAKPDLIKACNEQMDDLIKNQHLLKQANRVFVAFIWRDFTSPYINNSLQKLDELSGSNKLWIFGNKTISHGGIYIYNLYNIKKFFLMKDINQYAFQFKIDYSDTYKKLGLKNRKNTKFIDMQKLICKTNTECYILTPDKKVIMYDGDHFTPDGARYLGNNFYQMIK